MALACPACLRSILTSKADRWPRIRRKGGQGVHYRCAWLWRIQQARTGWPREGKPLGTSHEIIRDIGATVDGIQTRTGSETVSLLGWATGGHWAGMYALLYPEEVSHLVIYDSLYGATAGHPTLGPDDENADTDDRSRFNIAEFGTYRLNTAASLVPSRSRSIPMEDKTAWRDPAIAESYQQAAIASDTTANQREPASFRLASGAMESSFYLASGRQFWAAAPITANVLIIRSENDFWSRPEDVTTLEQRLVNAQSTKAVTIPEATHYVYLDRMDCGRSIFMTEVTGALSHR
jgi:pimeloyl-ACP methyl ester carboxylesterase